MEEFGGCWYKRVLSNFNQILTKKTHLVPRLHLCPLRLLGRSSLRRVSIHLLPCLKLCPLKNAISWHNYQLTPKFLHQALQGLMGIAIIASLRRNCQCFTYPSGKSQSYDMLSCPYRTRGSGRELPFGAMPKFLYRIRCTPPLVLNPDLTLPNNLHHKPLLPQHDLDTSTTTHHWSNTKPITRQKGKEPKRTLTRQQPPHLLHETPPPRLYLANPSILLHPLVLDFLLRCPLADTHAYSSTSPIYLSPKG